ncbi:MAG: tail-specific protease, partial [Chitinophagaceae bacterium]|nr:tail-specific protease [Chitinophagaceae bacterium]
MLNRRNLPVLLLILASGLFIGYRSLGTGGHPPTKYEKILKNVGEFLTQVHYSPKDLNDNFSKEVFKKYLEKVDNEKTLLMASDIEALRKYETKLDDEVLTGTVQFVPAVSEIFKKRVAETELVYKEALSQAFDFTKDESITIDPDKLDFAKNEAERKELYRKRMKYLVLDRFVELKESQEKNKGKQGFVEKTDVQMEKEARDKVLALMDRLYNRYKFKVNDDDRFSDYVNTITTSMDPHTSFFLPVDKRYFDEGMSGKFYGIGAALSLDEGNIRVGTLITGSPAWKSGEVTAGDVIKKVAQGNEEPVDLTGYVIEDAVKLIRGKKGTEVRLTLKKNDGVLKIVSLIRDEIVQDETFARSVIVNNGKSKVGYIYLPEFYADFEDPKGARCAIDVAKELIKLKQENVDGVVMDLRNNGGGSLFDVVQMVGLFIDEGPIVQVKDR